MWLEDMGYRVVVSDAPEVARDADVIFLFPDADFTQDQVNRLSQRVEDGRHAPGRADVHEHLPGHGLGAVADGEQDRLPAERGVVGLEPDLAVAARPRRAAGLGDGVEQDQRVAVGVVEVAERVVGRDAAEVDDRRAGPRLGGRAVQPALALARGVGHLRGRLVPLTVVGALNSALPFCLLAYTSLSVTAGLAYQDDIQSLGMSALQDRANTVYFDRAATYPPGGPDLRPLAVAVYPVELLGGERVFDVSFGVVTTVVVGNCGSSPWPDAGLEESASLVGVRAAELMEAPVMLAVIYWASRHLICSHPELYWRSRLAAGMIALLLLVGAELLVAYALGSRSIDQYIASKDPVSGSVYLASLLAFAQPGAEPGSVFPEGA